LYIGYWLLAVGYCLLLRLPLFVLLLGLLRVGPAPVDQLWVSVSYI
jgi:hypothetical protein